MRLSSVGAFFNLEGKIMRDLIKKLYEMGIDKDKVKKMIPNTVQIIKERGCLIISKSRGDNYTIVSVIENKNQEEVLKFVEEYK